MKSFSERLSLVEGGRFSEVLKGLRVIGVCEECFHFNPTVTDPGKGYRCKTLGSCPAATLSEPVKERLWKGILHET